MSYSRYELTATKDAFSRLGKSTQDKLRRMGISCPKDLVLHMPIRYENQTKITPVKAIRSSESCSVEGVVVSANSIPIGNNRMKITITLHDDIGDVFKIILTNARPYQKNMFPLGTRIRSFGKFTVGNRGKQVIHPDCKIVKKGDPLPQNLTAVYPTTQGLTQKLLSKIIHSAIEEKPWIDILPKEILLQYGLLSVEESLISIHFPPASSYIGISSIINRTHLYWKRIKFDELLSYHIALILEEKNRSTARTTYAIRTSNNLVKNFLKELSFELTDDQKQAWKEIQDDLCKTESMYRLLQGDVGSGKTVIAIMAALAVIESSHQVAFMAPTEVLAEQHYIRMLSWFSKVGVRLEILLSSTPSKKKQQILEDLLSGKLLIVIGTHTLIQKDVKFLRVALVIMDEQHRFGVEQRLSLLNKGDCPHQLLMSATPIPRTLAMAYSSHLRVSTLKQLPKGRQPIDTHLFKLSKKEKIIEKMRDYLNLGQQAYWICPLIEESDKIELSSILESQELIQKILPEYRIGILHGKMKSSHKASIMKSFLDHELDILVTTTVIEVGIDVPNANVIVIEHAERFGLAQLHQLRGRVGRGAEKSHCLLLYDSDISDTGKKRLLSLYRTQDGFFLSQMDLKIRGPGQIFGAKQSGMPQLRFSDLIADAELSQNARTCALKLLQNQYEIACKHYKFWLSDATCYVNT
ncbi:MULTISPECIES: ATP-dependent DNA helicase RecG [Candidatus Ichthyocystis]|uniref:ATP-dependent DNA helicase RecG n=1 Tax=Candidatus Ichthyocystis TaxID=2929841 RepID=UPI000AA08A8A|nr:MULTISPECIES: ATP-dependent DNA helicase RecG [Ichthyocystis]